MMLHSQWTWSAPLHGPAPPNNAPLPQTTPWGAFFVVGQFCCRTRPRTEFCLFKSGLKGGMGSRFLLSLRVVPSTTTGYAKLLQQQDGMSVYLA